MKTAVYTGSFDPITLGHLNVIERSSRLVDHLIIGIGVNIEKTGLFKSDERLDLVHRVTAHLDNVQVETFEGLAVNFAEKGDANGMIRGARPPLPRVFIFATPSRTTRCSPCRRRAASPSNEWAWPHCGSPSKASDPQHNYSRSLSYRV